MASYRSINSQFAEWEDRINNAFIHVNRSERVCLHPDRTITPDPASQSQLVECDYCPARAVHVGNSVDLAPFYYPGT